MFGEAVTLPNTNAVHFCDIFSDIGQHFCPAQTNSLKNQKLGHVKIIWDNMPYF